VSGKLLTPKLSHCVNEYISVGIGIRGCLVLGVAGILAGVYIGSCLAKGYNASVSHNSALAGVGAYGIEEVYATQDVTLPHDLHILIHFSFFSPTCSLKESLYLLLVS
jgi:hypothetical protein